MTTSSKLLQTLPSTLAPTAAWMKLKISQHPAWTLPLLQVDEEPGLKEESAAISDAVSAVASHPPATPTLAAKHPATAGLDEVKDQGAPSPQIDTAAVTIPASPVTPVEEPAVQGDKVIAGQQVKVDESSSTITAKDHYLSGLLVHSQSYEQFFSFFKEQ